jgi:hypothetical protein
MFLWILSVILLFSLYLHCVEQYKMGDELMVYETDYESRDQLLKACALKQPLVFALPASWRPPVTPLEQWEGQMRIVDNSDTRRLISARHATNVLLHSEETLLLSEGNSEWIIENIPLLYDMRSLDALWRPSWTLQTNYDVLAAGPGAATRFRWHFDSSRFFFVSTGRVRIKMTPFSHAAAFAKPQYNYSDFEFSSPLDVWSPTDKLTERMKFVDFEVHAGSAFYIPPYWWYSIQFLGTEKEKEKEKEKHVTQVYAFTYCTCINILAHGHHWARWFSQNHYSVFENKSENKSENKITELQNEKNEKIDLFEKIEKCGINNQQTTEQTTKQTTEQTEKNTTQNTIDVFYKTTSEVSAERCPI